MRNFQPQVLDIHSADYGKAFMFDQVVPAVPKLLRVVVFKGTQVLGEHDNPSLGHPPTVTITAPGAGNVWPIGNPQTIRWTASSPSGAPLSALVQYSPDGGATRMTLRCDATGSSLVVNPDELHGSTNAYLYVHVSDGLNTASAQVGPFTVASKPPVVRIVTSQANRTVMVHMPLSLQGTAFDPQEPLPDVQFRWTSNRVGYLGSGSQLTTRTLSVGIHVLTLTVVDSHGLVGQAQVTFQVRAAPWAFLPLVQVMSPGDR